MQGHLRLAEGLIKSVKVSEAPSEYELRNAFSRAYYAVFHACRGYLWATGVDVESLGRKHGRLHDAMEKWLGKAFGDFLRKIYEWRRKSDYVPEWNQLPLEKYLEELRTAQMQCYFVPGTGRRLFSN